ncbi:MAG: shikimate dehydrogenase [Pseudomonadota bacterium]
MTTLLGVIGDPIAHSLSPLIHNYWLRSHGVAAHYEAMQVSAGDLGSALETLAKRSVRGVNITLPHKEDALALAAQATPLSAKIGAANTLTYNVEAQTWHADNTDAPGFLDTLNDLELSDLQGRKVLLLGAGGSARALALALAQAGAELTILNRTQAKAAELASHCGANAVFGGLDRYHDLQSDQETVISTLSLGHGGEAFGLGPGEDRLFYDISYGKAAARQAEAARQAGWRVVDGLPMLVAQAARSFAIWFDIEPERDVILRRCRKVVEALA